MNRKLQSALHSIGLAEHPDKAPVARSPKWPAVRKAWIKEHPACAACGTKTDIDVHHIQVFHQHPERELDPTNLITLCTPHHLTFGHLMSWKSWNTAVVADVNSYRHQVAARPSS